MKYIINRSNYIIEKISWLDNRKKSWDQQFSELMMSYNDNILSMIDEIKDKFNDKNDPIEVHKVYLEYSEKSFDDLIEKIRIMEDEKYLEKFWNEFILNLSLWKDTFKKMSEKLDNYNSIFKLAYEIFSVYNRYLTKNKSSKYYELLKGELDDQRQSVIDFINEIKEDLKLRIIDIDPEEIFDMSNLDEKETDELNLNPGDEVRYYKNNKEENIAIISHDQEELKDKDSVKLVSKQSGEQFEIDKSDIIEIIPKHKTLNQEVSDKLKHIKNDPDKLDKLNDYLTDLEKTDEKYVKTFEELQDTYIDDEEFYLLVTDDEEWILPKLPIEKEYFDTIASQLSQAGGLSLYPTSEVGKFNSIQEKFSIWQDEEMIEKMIDFLSNNSIPLKSSSGKKLGTSNEYQYKIVVYKKAKTRVDNIKLFENNLFGDDDIDPELLKVNSNKTRAWLSNSEFKRTNIKLIDTMLKNVYEPYGHWKKFQFWGVADLPWEENSWSILNKINTNFSALSIMINELNRALIEGGSNIPVFNFSDKINFSREFYQEYYRMMNFIDKNKEKIFLKLHENDGSQIINKIIERMQRTTKLGDKAEYLVAKYIKNIFSGSTDIKVLGGGGEYEDMIGGSDIKFMLNGNKKNIQVKKCKGVFNNKSGFKVVGTSFNKHYNVDYISCVTKHYMYFFEYDKNKIQILSSGDIIIDHSLLIKSFKLA